ncbi:MAG: radical SAM protein [Acidobacteriota bacterium]
MLVETERQPQGPPARVVTVFLAGSECPYTCVFCDLWRYTLDQPTPPGAIPAQIERALERVATELSPQAELSPKAHLKLYNASNFFDPRAVPPEDDAAIAALCRGFSRVIVECHPRLVGERCFDFAERLDGELQVAMGLETVHPDAQPRLGKQATLDDFATAARRLGEHGISWRAFVLVGAPYVGAGESVESAVRSASWAFEHGAEHVTLIPVRGGNGEMERLAREGHFERPTLAQLEAALEQSLDLIAGPGAGAVTVDTWDLEKLAECEACQPPRTHRLDRYNAGDDLGSRPACIACRPDCE